MMMKVFPNDTILLFSSLLISILIIKISNPNKATYHLVKNDKAIKEVNLKFKSDLSVLSDQILDFEEALSKTNPELIRESYEQLRYDFKQVEFFIEYLDKEAYDKLINGAPLPKLEKKVADLRVLEPKGLQVIDELMAEPFSSEIQLQLQKETTHLKKSYGLLKNYLEKRYLSDRQFFEASRQALIRMMSLGITGFDTPGTQLGIQDAHSILESLQEYFAFYEDEMQNVNQKNHLKETLSVFSIGIKKTKNANFEDFDRLIFIKKIINPLYNRIKETHLTLEYETIEEVAKYMPAVNYRAENIFSKEFLDAFYYVSLENDSLFEKKKLLGKLLFYDPVLSSDNTMSCASCHNPQKGFTDGFQKSISNTGESLQRNALTLNYSVYATGFFHDLRAKRLEDQFEHVVVSVDEFNTDYNEIIEKLSKSEAYLELFKNAFPQQGKKIRSYAIDYALTAYVMSLNTFDSPVDNYFSASNATLSKDVKAGFNLFMGKANCATCHFPPLFSGTVPPLFNESEAEVLGVPISKIDSLTIDPDLGRLQSGSPQEVADFYAHAFKTPTLRNIELTGPYMHNGIYETLEEVIQFYNQGGGAGMGIDLPHQTLAADPLNLTQAEKDQLIAFMKALTDSKKFEAPKRLPTDFKSDVLNNRGGIH